MANCYTALRHPAAVSLRDMRALLIALALCGALQGCSSTRDGITTESVPDCNVIWIDTYLDSLSSTEEEIDACETVNEVAFSGSSWRVFPPIESPVARVLLYDVGVVNTTSLCRSRGNIAEVVINRGSVIEAADLTDGSICDGTIPIVREE